MFFIQKKNDLLKIDNILPIIQNKHIFMVTISIKVKWPKLNYAKFVDV